MVRKCSVMSLLVFGEDLNDIRIVGIWCRSLDFAYICSFRFNSYIAEPCIQVRF